MAQDSVNAPLVCGCVAALLAHLAQSMFWPSEIHHHIYVDDPIIAARGLARQRDRCFAIVILTWPARGIQLAFKKAERGQEVDWVGAHLACRTDPEPAIEVTAKQDIVDDVSQMVTTSRSSNIAPIKDVQSLVGKGNHIAGMIEAYERSRLPRQCRVRAYFGYAMRVSIVADASPWGLGGHLLIEGAVKAYFASPLTQIDADLLRAPLGEAAGQQVWEALAMLVALRLWKQVWLQQGARLAATADSISTLALLLNFRAKTSSYGLGVVCREMALEFGDRAYKPRVYVHLPGIAGDVAG
ncbi:unnamed protein product, partial [Prorocentrum cordatum]